MKKTIFRGAGVALVTPMNNDGSVNYEELEKLIDFQISNGTDAIQPRYSPKAGPCHSWYDRWSRRASAPNGRLSSFSGRSRSYRPPSRCNS